MEDATEDGVDVHQDVDKEQVQEETKISKWGILPYILKVVEITNHTFMEVLDFPIITTLYLTCYQQDKIEFERQELEKWKRTH